MSISGSGFAPGEQVALLSSNGPGSAVMPGGPCAATGTGLSPSGLALRATGMADDGGMFGLSPTIPEAACGAYVQIVSLTACGEMTPTGQLHSGPCGGTGFESGAWPEAGWTDGGGAVVTDPVHEGTYALHRTPKRLHGPAVQERDRPFRCRHS
jgi:hypothetical protein